MKIFFLILSTLLLSTVLSAQTTKSVSVFNGTTSYMSVPNSAEMSPSAAITIEAWINIDPTGVGNRCIYGKNYLTSTYLGINGSNLVRFYPKGGNGIYIESTTPVQPNTWTHIAATYNGATSAIYINGVSSINSTTITGGIGVNTDSAYIGCDRSGTVPDYFFKGKIFNLRLWNKAKTSSEMDVNRFTIFNVRRPTGEFAGLASVYCFNATGQEWSGDNADGANLRNMTFLFYDNQPFRLAAYNNFLELNSNSYISMQNITDANATQKMTLESWVNRDSLSTYPAFQTIISKSNGLGRNDYRLDVMANGAIRLMLNSGVSGYVSQPWSIKAGIWHHVASTFNTATGLCKIYINGDSVASGTIAVSSIDNNPDSVYIGNVGSPTSTNKFAGGLDEIRIWKDSVRSSEDIKRSMFTTRFNDVAAPFTGNCVFAFDSFSNYVRSSNGGILSALNFIGNAFIRTGINSFAPAPLLYSFADNFIDGTYTFQSRIATIPDNNTTGITDSVFVSSTGAISKLKAFVMIDHVTASQLTLKLISPSGMELTLVNSGTVALGSDIMTIFTDDADSSIISPSNQTQPAFSPRVKPQNPLSIFIGQQRQGWWKLKVSDNVASSSTGLLYGWGIQPTTLTSVENNTEIVSDYKLDQNYPNPFNPVTSINYSIPHNTSVSLKVYDLLGKEVAELVNQTQTAGNYRTEFNGSSLASGVYFYKLVTPSFSMTKKMLIIK